MSVNPEGGALRLDAWRMAGMFAVYSFCKSCVWNQYVGLENRYVVVEFVVEFVVDMEGQYLARSFQGEFLSLVCLRDRVLGLGNFDLMQAPDKPTSKEGHHDIQRHYGDQPYLPCAEDAPMYVTLFSPFNGMC